MKISKTTEKMAAKRGFGFFTEKDSTITFGPEGRFSRKADTFEILELDDDGEIESEFLARYEVKEDGLFFVGSCYGPSEEFPYWIESESKLREVIKSLPGLSLN
jgi:hypothetical protein